MTTGRINQVSDPLIKADQGNELPRNSRLSDGRKTQTVLVLLLNNTSALNRLANATITAHRAPSFLPFLYPIGLSEETPHVVFSVGLPLREIKSSGEELVFHSLSPV